ncbi:hypothetical protein DAQ1742_01285 [Dickeya aquatica]|uniref:Uncharacterized protein n=1 Tax=Dickeya aquatica TaxID=1401087 RepID=A0A375A885_9GAMM|nr:hypothetical protein DAQ1742_01285 [Dickeya aquatica]
MNPFCRTLNPFPFGPHFLAGDVNPWRHPIKRVQRTALRVQFLAQKASDIF